MGEVQSIVVLTGAGISARKVGWRPSRGDGLWEGHRSRIWRRPRPSPRSRAGSRLPDARRARLGEVEPQCRAWALARLDAEWPGELLIVTRMSTTARACGSEADVHMHGELTSGWSWHATSGSAGWEKWARARLPGLPGLRHVRPDIVWFGEMPTRWSGSTPR